MSKKNDNLASHTGIGYRTRDWNKRNYSGIPTDKHECLSLTPGTQIQFKDAGRADGQKKRMNSNGFRTPGRTPGVGATRTMKRTFIPAGNTKPVEVLYKQVFNGKRWRTTN